jgi:hypothetical protein
MVFKEKRVSMQEYLRWVPLGELTADNVSVVDDRITVHSQIAGESIEAYQARVDAWVEHASDRSIKVLRMAVRVCDTTRRVLEEVLANAIEVALVTPRQIVKVSSKSVLASVLKLKDQPITLDCFNLDGRKSNPNCVHWENIMLHDSKAPLGALTFYAGEFIRASRAMQRDINDFRPAYRNNSERMVSLPQSNAMLQSTLKAIELPKE